MNDQLEDIQYKEAILKYAKDYNDKKNEEDFSDKERIYVIYARKSTTSEDRQVQTIEDQIDWCFKYAKDHDLNVIPEPIREQYSAKTAGTRKRFNEMIERLKKGDYYNSILAWHPDRLSRNMKEAGEILDMLDNGKILDLKFPSYTFNNDAAGKMTLSILFAMAKEFSDKLGEDTKRGGRRKVILGKAMGKEKKGYYIDEDHFFRADQVKFDIYKNAWELYIKGKSQNDVLEYLKEHGIKMTANGISRYFQDPFPTGIFCYGKHIINLNDVDPHFKPMISYKDFIEVQNRARAVSTGWKSNEEFKAFSKQFVLCGECGHPMTSGVVKGNRYRYLRVNCSDEECIENRRNMKQKPISNEIAGGVIVDFAISAVEELIKIDEKTYEKVKSIYFEEKSNVVKEINETIKRLNISKGKLNKKIDILKERFKEDYSTETLKAISKDLEVMYVERNNLDKQIKEYEIKKDECEFQMLAEFPNYPDFLNFFKNIADTLKDTEDIYLVDQLVRLLFLNLTAKDKKVYKYRLREPFEAYENLKFLSGVEDGI